MPKGWSYYHVYVRERDVADLEAFKVQGTPPGEILRIGLDTLRKERNKP